MWYLTKNKYGITSNKIDNNAYIYVYLQTFTNTKLDLVYSAALLFYQHKYSHSFDSVSSFRCYISLEVLRVEVPSPGHN